MPRLQTHRLDLVPATADVLRAELESPRALEAALECRVPESWPPELYDADATRYSLRQLLSDPSAADWSFYYVVRRVVAEGMPLLIGAGGFKGPPDDHGVVEVGYAILAEHQRQGYATEAVHGWLRFAFSSTRVTMVVGQTLPSLTPSIGVLEKLGFRFAGSGHDPHAPAGEEVIRYELSRADFAGRL